MIIIEKKFLNPTGLSHFYDKIDAKYVDGDVFTSAIDVINDELINKVNDEDIASLSNQEIDEIVETSQISDYDSTKTYSVGDFCFYNEILYCCITDISFPEAWNSNHWEEATESSTLVELIDLVQDANAEISDLKDDLSQTQNLENNILFSGTYSGTMNMTVDQIIPAGTYTVHIDQITSTDTDSDKCLVLFRDVNNTDIMIPFDRGSNISQTLTFENEIVKLMLYASDTYGHSRDDSFSFTGFSVSYSYPLLDAIANMQTEIGSIRSDVAADLSAFEADIVNYNIVNYIPRSGDFATKTSNGVTFSWDDNRTVCRLNGTPTGFAVDRFFFDAESTLGLECGKTYFFNVIPSISGIGIELFFYINGTLGSGQEITVPKYITVPTNATGILARVMAHSGIGSLTNETVYVEVLNALPIESHIYAKLASQYVSNNSLTLGDIKENGYYVIDSSWTLTDAPSALASTGGLLTVECYQVNTISGNLTKQTFEGTISPHNKKVYTRIRTAGSWNAWTDMTAINRGAIIPTGDSTDRKAEIEATLNREGVCILTPGEYYVSGIVMPNGTALKGSGIGSTKLIMISGGTGSCVKMGTKCSVSDLALDGQDASNYRANDDRHGIGWVGTYVSESSSGTYPIQGQVNNLFIEGFRGGGIYCNQTSMQSYSGLQAMNIIVHNCWCGIYNPLISEYCEFTNIKVTQCYYGAYINGGNNVFTNCIFTSNVCGLLMLDDSDAAKNNSHGSFIGCCFNHSNDNAGIAISLSGLDNGEIFSGCQIFYGKIRVMWSTGIRFVGCNFGRSTPITVQNSKAVTFDSCQFRESSDTTVTQSSNTGFKFRNCMLYDGSDFDPLST